MKKVYFPGLNSLRFFAALLVIISHIEQFKNNHSLGNLYQVPFINESGGLAVTFFFVLSGFLITYLLFVEKEASNTISIKDFYLRRIFRIWPVYYLCVLLGFFILPLFSSLDVPYLSPDLYKDFNSKLLLHLLFLPNVSKIIYPEVPYLGPVWSIGVEEQFYLIWPLLILYFKNYLKLFISFLCIFYILKITAIAIPFFIIDNKVIIIFCNGFRDFLYLTRLDCMTIGALYAYFLFFKKTRILNILSKKHLQILVYIIIIISMAYGVTVPNVNHLFYAILFGILIINVSRQVSLFNLENRYLNYLGKISYGLYMYHEISIGITIFLVSFLGITVANSFLSFLLSLLIILVTVAIASFSYHFLELKFLNLKEKFSFYERIKSLKKTPKSIKENYDY